LIPQAVLEYADGAIVGHASGVARRLDAQVLGAANFHHFKDLSLPPFAQGLRDNPELAAADTDFARHQVTFVSVELLSSRIVRFSRRQYETRNLTF
jgi:hypothetical protein